MANAVRTYILLLELQTVTSRSKYIGRTRTETFSTIRCVESICGASNQSCCGPKSVVLAVDL
jgi:hypothetical protein